VTTSRWRAWAELLAAVSVVVTLIVLVVEVRANTKAIERQILMDRTANVTAPYTSGPELLAAFEKVKRVDGWDPTQRAFMHQYGLEPGEAISWMMFLVRVWKGLDADFAYSGPSEQLATSITSLLSFPDNRIFYQPGVVSPEFAAYVESVAPGASTVREALLDEVLPDDAIAHDSVRATLESYYGAFSDRDWSRFAEHFWPGATLTAIWTPPGESAERVVATSVPAFVEQAPLGPGSREIFEERMTSARIAVHGDLAQAWAGYEARFGDPGEVSEWRGIDAFTLMRHDGEWRISSLAYVSDSE
jgi:hypothetical protein